MNRIFLPILIAIFTMSLPAYQALAHVCDDVLEHDPIVIWPEKETIKIVKTGQFKIFLRNDYSDSIKRVKLTVRPSPFEISVTPALIERVTPGQRVFFLVNLTIPQETKPGSYPLLMEVNAAEFAVARKVNLKIEVERPTPEAHQPPPEAVIEVIPEDILIAMSAFPDVVEAEPGEVVKFTIFVRSGHTKCLHDLVLSVSSEDFEVLAITPASLDKLEAGDSAPFEVTLSIPEEIKHGDYLVLPKLKVRELAVERGTSLLIRVKEVKEWLTYLYALAILFLVGLLIWRWQKTTQRRSRLLPGQ